MTTTALPSETALRRLATADSTPATSANISPIDSPRNSPSSTSLSSLASEDEAPIKQAPHNKLVDQYGNAFEIPDYSISDIHKAIPKHCFERSAATGLYYVARDLLALGTVFYVAYNYLTPENVPNKHLRAGLWFLYTVLQGLTGTGLWVLAHECGHQAFSPSKVLNDTVGWVCHSLLLVPYFSWKISHGKHHKATGHMERDMVFVPKTREKYATRVGKFAHELSELMEETPMYTALHLFGQQIGGWQSYLLANVTGHDHHDKYWKDGRGKGYKNGFFQGINHFDPRSPIYDAKEGHLILLSDLGLLIVGTALYYIGKNFGWANLAVWYIAPYFWVHHWLVAITYLQHTDPSLPHYTPESWTYTRGAAATIDREFGFIGRQMFHGIIETHVLHHYISTIPFYHADEATEAIKKVMGKHYRADVAGGPMGFLKSLWVNMRYCQWVESLPGTTGEAAGVLFFRNHNGLLMKPKVTKEGETGY